MNVIIIVQGKKEAGKTPAVIAVSELLGKAINREPVFYDKNAHGDVTAVYEYHRQRIGIRSAGDPKSDLEEGLGELLEEIKDGGHGCNIILTTCRTTPDTKQEVENEIAKVKKIYGCHVIWTSHYHYDKGTAILPNGFDLNKQFAPSMVGLILELLK